MKKLYVKKSKIDRSGLFSNNKIAKNEFISYVKGPITILKNNDEATKKNVENWIGVGRYSWINTDDSIFRYINHSCEPNAIIKGKRSVYALVDIPNETEITIAFVFAAPSVSLLAASNAISS